MHFDGRSHTWLKAAESQLHSCCMWMPSRSAHMLAQTVYKIELIALVPSSIIICGFKVLEPNTRPTMASFFLLRHPVTLFYSRYSHDDKVQAALI